jgi:hypothetical protein
MSGEGAWQDYLGHCRKMVDAVSQGWPRGDADYHAFGSGFLELAEDANETVRGILDLYDKLLAKAPQVPLLTQVVQPSQGIANPDHRIELNRPGFTGGQNSRRIARYGTYTKEEDLEAVFTRVPRTHGAASDGTPR